MDMVRLLVVFLFSFQNILVAAQAPAGNPPDPLHARVFNAPPNSFDGIQWTFNSRGKIFSSPLVHAGHVYFGSGDSSVYALMAETGKVAWKFKTGGAVHSSSSIFNQYLYIGSFDGNYYCLDLKTGKEQWRFATGGERWPGGRGYFGWKPDSVYLDDPWDYFLSTPVVSTTTGSAVVYFGSSDGHLYAVDAESGALRWKYKTGGIVHTTPVVYDGKVFIGSWDAFLYAVDASTGKLVWKFQTGENPGMTGLQSSPVVAFGSVFFGARDAHFYCVDVRTGKPRWKYAAENAWILSTAAVDDNRIYVGTSDSYLTVALDPFSGKEIWRSKLKGYVFGSPCLSARTVFTGDFTGALYAIDKTSGKVIDVLKTPSNTKNFASVLKDDGSMDFQYLARNKDGSLYKTVTDVMDQLYSLGSIVSSPAISGKTLFVGSADGTMYAVRLGVRP